MSLQLLMHHTHHKHYMLNRFVLQTEFLHFSLADLLLGYPGYKNYLMPEFFRFYASWTAGNTDVMPQPWMLAVHLNFALLRTSIILNQVQIVITFSCFGGFRLFAVLK